MDGSCATFCRSSEGDFRIESELPSGQIVPLLFFQTQDHPALTSNQLRVHYGLYFNFFAEILQTR